MLDPVGKGPKFSTLGGSRYNIYIIYNIKDINKILHSTLFYVYIYIHVIYIYMLYIYTCYICNCTVYISVACKVSEI